MKRVTLQTVLADREYYLQEMLAGKICIYPTDTLYGLGCRADSIEAVERIYDIKKRDNKPVSVIAPSKEWIYMHGDISQKVGEEIDRTLPGPYTYIVSLKHPEYIAPHVNNGGNTLGIRIPKSRFTELVQELGIPFVTTSVNISGQPSATSIDEIDPEILAQVDYVIETDEAMSGVGSTIYDATSDELKVLRK
ncbi:MAG: threonylcarbamoyl-AMP synthase [Candidatus Peribacteria bacterium]|nr:MAG: threonylcarbamoyl-AMP synthase [Candidatus Peribacteria bacterium]